MLGSVLSCIIVGALVESGEGGYADLVAETYAEQDLSDEGKETFLNSLGLVSLLLFLFVIIHTIKSCIYFCLHLMHNQLYFAHYRIYFGILIHDI